jgi:flagellar protein FliL
LAKRVTGISRRLCAAALVTAGLAAGPVWASGTPAAGGPAYMTLAPIVLPVFDGNTVTRQAGVMLTLELAEGKTEADVEPQRRRLVDAFISDLYALFEQRHDADRVIDAGLIKSRLGETATRILGPGVVHEVLIQQAFERQRR